MGYRIRERGGYTTVLGAGTNVRCDNSNGLVSTPTFSKAEGLYEVIKDVPSRDFQRRSGEGEVIITPYERFRGYRTVSGLGNRTWSYDTNGTTCKSCTTPNAVTQKSASLKAAVGMGIIPMVTPAVNLQDLMTLAGTRAMAGVDASLMQGFVDAAEAKQTWKMFEKAARSFGTWTKRAQKRARKGGFKSVAEMVAEQWLQYRYGIMPFYYSVMAAYQAATKENPPKRQTS